MIRFWVGILYAQVPEHKHQESFRHWEVPGLDPVFNLLVPYRSLGYL